MGIYEKLYKPTAQTRGGTGYNVHLVGMNPYQKYVETTASKKKSLPTVTLQTPEKQSIATPTATNRYTNYVAAVSDNLNPELHTIEGGGNALSKGNPGAISEQKTPLTPTTVSPEPTVPESIQTPSQSVSPSETTAGTGSNSSETPSTNTQYTSFINSLLKPFNTVVDYVEKNVVVPVKSKLQGVTGNGGEEGGEEASTGGNTAYQDLVDYYDKQRQGDLDAADAQHRRDVNDAQGVYERSLATHGQNAEKLLQMGLTNSGYSNYINSIAQADRSANISAAGANYQTAVDKANDTYDENVNNLKLGAYENFVTTYQQAVNGELASMPDETITSYGKMFGWTDEQVNEIINANTGYKDYVTKEENALTYNTYLQQLSSGVVDFTSISDDNKAGKLFPEQYEALKTEVNKNVDTGEAFFINEAGEAMTYNQAQKQYQNAVDSGIFDEAVLGKIKETLDRNYLPSVLSGIDTTSSKVSMGNDFKIQIPGGDVVRVDVGLPMSSMSKSGGKTDYPNGTVFAYNNKIWVVINGTPHRVMLRDNNPYRQEEYDTLYNYFFN